MIATDHQYRVTSEKLSKFRGALEGAVRGDPPDVLRRVQVQRIKEQIEKLETELREYDELRNGQIEEIALNGLAELPAALVKARIARGLSQSALAELLGVRPQQIQRWEADGFSRVGFDHLRRIAGELRVSIRDKLNLEGDPPIAPSEVRRTMVAAGLPREAFDRAVLPVRNAANNDFILADEIDARVRALFGVGAASFRGAAGFAHAAMRFKLPASANQKRTRAYAAYVDGVCHIMAKCLPYPTRALPNSWREMRALLFPDGGISLGAAISGCWSMGVVVVALDDPVAFHGACWRHGGRTVIVLKNPSSDEFRWLFDLVHELFHAVATLEGDFVVLEAEETSAERRHSQEERRANRFAAELLTNGRLAELTDRIVDIAQGSVPQLRSATIKVANQAKLPVGLLANLLAQRLSDDPSNQSWWGTAASLQVPGDSPWKIIRDAFLTYAKLNALDRVERDIVKQLMETPGE
jgi:transcriptional regulator with XRE-family HTH domain